MIVLEHAGPAGTRPDPNVWRAQVWAVPNELQRYTASGNAWCDGDGHLVLEARRGADGTYTSARLDTKGRLRVEPGSRVEFDALLPHNPGAFPAPGWMTGTNQPTVGYAKAGEIDTVEVAGGWLPGHALLNAHAAYYDEQLARMAAAQGVTVAELQARQTHYQTGWTEKARIPLDLDQWHRYALDRDENGVRWWIDGQVRKTVTKAEFTALGVTWPFGKPMDLIFNVAVGSSGGTPVLDADGAWSARMLVGPIRIGRYSEFPAPT